MPSFYINFNDCLLGVDGIKRKRSRYRCEKRGEDFDKYDESNRAPKRMNAKNVYSNLLSEEIKNANYLYSRIEQDKNWLGGTLIVPFTKTKRKRSAFRHKNPRPPTLPC